MDFREDERERGPQPNITTTTMPGEVRVTKGSSLKTSGGQTEGMIRMNAITDMSDQICGTLMIAKPHSSSAVHHHGEEDTIVYAVSGNGTVVSGPNGSNRQELSPGDWALIPAYAEHQEVNDGDEDVVWVIHRGGRTPIVHNIEDWGHSQHEETRAQGSTEQSKQTMDTAPVGDHVA